MDDLNQLHCADDCAIKLSIVEDIGCLWIVLEITFRSLNWLVSETSENVLIGPTVTGGEQFLSGSSRHLIDWGEVEECRRPFHVGASALLLLAEDAAVRVPLGCARGCAARTIRSRTSVYGRYIGHSTRGSIPFDFAHYIGKSGKINRTARCSTLFKLTLFCSNK